MEHTKEKWIAIRGVVRLSLSTPPIFGNGLWNILPEDDVERLPTCTIDYADDHDEPTRESAEKIARLIAAAPELLEACELIVLFCESNGEPVDGFRFREGITKARAAIAKAKGKL